jgi:hypothetical protein
MKREPTTMLIFLYWLIVPLISRDNCGSGPYSPGSSFISIPVSLVVGAISYLLIRDGAAPRWVVSIGSSVYAIALNLLLLHNGMPDPFGALVLPAWLATTLGLFWVGWLLGAPNVVTRPRRGT